MSSRLAAAAIGLAIAAASPGAAAPVRIEIGTGTGSAGGSARVEVTIDPADQNVIGASNDIEFSPDTPIRRRADGSLDCEADPRLLPLLPPRFTCIATPPHTCLRLRAIVFRPIEASPFTAGAMYACTFAIDAAAAPGSTYRLRMRAAAATGAVGRALATDGEDGAIRIIAPTATLTPSQTAVPTATPTPSPSASFTPSLTQTPSQTPTPSRTRTRASTRTRTPSPRTPIPTATVTLTPTSTPTPVIGLRVGADPARPGELASIAIELTDRQGRASGLSFDLIVADAALDAVELAASCALDARIIAHGLSATVVGNPPAPLDQRRVRIVVSEQVPPRELGSGPLVLCQPTVRADAPAGNYPIAIERLFAADVEGTLLLGVGGAPGVLIVDPQALSPTPTRTPTRTAAATATPSATPTVAFTATASATPSASPAASPTAVAPPSPTPSADVPPTPTATPPACAGDCDGDGAIAINELVQSVTLAASGTPPAACAAADTNSDGRITIGELIAAVSVALGGCAP